MRISDWSSDVCSSDLFSIEYLLRFWTAGEVAAWRSWRGRLVWMARPWHLFDLFLIAVFLLPHLGAEIFILRFLRIGRVFMVLRLTRITVAGQMLGACITARDRKSTRLNSSH